MSLLGMNSVTIWHIMGFLFVFGFLYNLLIGWLERRGYDEGYTALLVVVGVAVTLIAYSFMDIVPTIEMALAFAASGFWMVIGSWWRHVQARKHAQDLLRGTK
jgi:predicted tellurium resistance membrane protein TerC